MLLLSSKHSPMDPLGQFMAAGRPNLVLGHQMPASNALGQPSYTTVEEGQTTHIRIRCECSFKPEAGIDSWFRWTHTILNTYIASIILVYQAGVGNYKYYNTTKLALKEVHQKLKRYHLHFYHKNITLIGKSLLWFHLRTPPTQSTPPYETASTVTFNQIKPEEPLHKLWHIIHFTISGLTNLQDKPSWDLQACWLVCGSS